MSKAPAPAPKQNFLQTALLMMIVWTGFLFWTQNNKPPEVPTGDLLTTLRKQNRDLQDISIVQTLHAYNRSLDSELNKERGQIDEAKKKGSLTTDEAETRRKAVEERIREQKVRAMILVADTQLKAGIVSNQTDRIRDAYATLVGANRQYRGEPIWQRTFPVWDVTEKQNLGWNRWSGHELYDRVTATLSKRNKDDLVWGFIPGYQLMDFLVHLSGANPGFSYALAGFFLALLVRASVFHLATKQIMSGRKMSQLMPLVQEIKKEYENDPTQQQLKTMALYKEYGVNPFAGCGPVFIQMPLFYAIYQCMLHYQFEFEKGTFLWINPTLSKATNGFIAPNLGQQDAILIIVYGITMLVTTFLTPVSSIDPAQVKQQRLMGIGMSVLFTIFMFSGAVPVVSGFVLYWIFTNLLATTQTLVLYRRPMAPLEKVNTATGGVYPKKPAGWAQRFMDQMNAAQEEALKRQAEQERKDGKGPSNGKATTFVGTGETKTGTPAKHKPKKRK
jgi:YidC/Oxa1 family membrane protein insertase